MSSPVPVPAGRLPNAVDDEFDSSPGTEQVEALARIEHSMRALPG
jgi:hypothetical protein